MSGARCMNTSASASVAQAKRCEACCRSAAPLPWRAVEFGPYRATHTLETPIPECHQSSNRGHGTSICVQHVALHSPSVLPSMLLFVGLWTEQPQGTSALGLQHSPCRCLGQGGQTVANGRAAALAQGAAGGEQICECGEKAGVALMRRPILGYCRPGAPRASKASCPKEGFGLAFVLVGYIKPAVSSFSIVCCG